MNVVDFCIVAACLALVAAYRNLSFTYFMVVGAGTFGGYIVGVMLSGLLTPSISDDVKQGIVTLCLMFGLAIAGGITASFIARRLKTKIILSPLFKIDKILVWPAKIILAIVGVVLLAQTLLYVPILSLQFVAQGSSLLMATNKIVPSTPVETAARRIAPNQFSELVLEHDPAPITYKSSAQAGEFQDILDTVAPSIVHVSTNKCNGLHSGSGFVVAPHIIVTNNHVASGAGTIYVRDQKGVYPATPLVLEPDYDLAVLYSHFITAPPISMSNRDVTPGTKAVSTGYPYSSDELQYKIGEALYRPRTSTTSKLDPDNTAAFNNGLGPGSSGGPVFDTNGEVIAVNAYGLGEDLIGVKAYTLVRAMVDKAEGKFFPTSTDLCDVPAGHF